MKNIKNMKKYAIILIVAFCVYIIFRELYNYKLEGYATHNKTIPPHDDSLGSINVVCENNGQETPIHDHSTHLSAAHRHRAPHPPTAYDKSACTQQEFAAGNCYFEDTSGATAVNGGDDAVNKNSVTAAHAAVAAATAAVAAANTKLHQVNADSTSTVSEKTAAEKDANEAKAKHAAAVTALATAVNGGDDAVKDENEAKAKNAGAGSSGHKDCLIYTVPTKNNPEGHTWVVNPKGTRQWIESWKNNAGQEKKGCGRGKGYQVTVATADAIKQASTDYTLKSAAAADSCKMLSACSKDNPNIVAAMSKAGHTGGELSDSERDRSPVGGMTPVEMYNNCMSVTHAMSFVNPSSANRVSGKDASGIEIKNSTWPWDNRGSVCSSIMDYHYPNEHPSYDPAATTIDASTCLLKIHKLTDASGNSDDTYIGDRLAHAMSDCKISNWLKNKRSSGRKDWLLARKK